MNTKYSKCQKCPAFHLLDDQRKQIIDKWEYKRDQYISRMKKIRLILLGESMPPNRYLYDLDTNYKQKGLRYTLKQEISEVGIDDHAFLHLLELKGIILHDCALCPIGSLKTNKEKRAASTYCFLTINQTFILKNPDVPIATIFPSKRGYLKNEIPFEIKSRVIGNFRFSNQLGLNELYKKVKT